MKRQFLFSVLAMLAMVLALSTPAFAAGDLVNGFTQLVTSNIALVVGLALALFGLYEILVAQNTGVGVGMVVFGLLIAFVPNIFDGLFSAIRTPMTSVGNKVTSGYLSNSGN